MFCIRLIALISILVFSFSTKAHALSDKNFFGSGVTVTIEPIVGYEVKAEKDPVPHTRGMLLYGARVVVGHPLISGEGEYTLGTTNETFPTQDQNLKTNKENVRLGLRTFLEVISELDFIFRAGGQASRTKTQVTVLSTATSSTGPTVWEIRPYLGSGLQLNISDLLSAGAEATYVFRSIKDWSQNEIQTTFSLKFDLNSQW